MFRTVKSKFITWRYQLKKIALNILFVGFTVWTNIVLLDFELSFLSTFPFKTVYSSTKNLALFLYSSFKTEMLSIEHFKGMVNNLVCFEKFMEWIFKIVNMFVTKLDLLISIYFMNILVRRVLSRPTRWLGSRPSDKLVK